MQDTKKTHQLVKERKNKNGLSQDTTDDAGDLAAFLREKEENSALNKPKHEKKLRGDGKNYANRFKHMDKKVIRRKITKTHPDGTQTVTFEFIIDCNEDELAEVSKKAALRRKKQNSEKKKSKTSNPPIGHSMFEEDETTFRTMPVKRGKTRGRNRNSDADYVQPKKSSVSKKSKQKEGKKKQKRKRDEEDDDIYSRPTLKRGTNNRKGRVSSRELKPHAKMAECLEEIRSVCEKRPHSAAFHRPVDRIACPLYYDSIKNPIDLQTIRDKIKK